MTDNQKARLQINELYSRVLEFRAEKLSPVLNPDLAEACRAIPELRQFQDELETALSLFNNRLLKFAFEKYPCPND